MLKNVAGSALAKTIIVLTLTAVFSIMEGVWWPMLAPLLFAGYYWRSLVFEVLLMVHIIESSLGSWNYFSRIDQYIYLGNNVIINEFIKTICLLP